MSDIANRPNRRSSSCPMNPLTAAELQTRQSSIRTAATQARATYPLAASNLEWWLDRNGARRDVPLLEFDFSRSDCGLPAHLTNTHRRVIALGHQSGVVGVPAASLGLQGRLRLPSTDPRSLQPGVTQVLDWEDSIRAKMVEPTTAGFTPTAPLQRDLSIGLGGYTIHSRVEVRAQAPSAAGTQVIEIVSWRVQVCDYYNWIVSTRAGICVSAQAPIPIPQGIPVPPVPEGAGQVRTLMGETVVLFNDQWMAEVEHAGGAHPYEIYSEVFDAPASVRTNFEVVNGSIRV